MKLFPVWFALRTRSTAPATSELMRKKRSTPPRQEDLLESKDIKDMPLDEDIFPDINGLEEKVDEDTKEGSLGRRQIRKPARYMA